MTDDSVQIESSDTTAPETPPCSDGEGQSLIERPVVRWLVTAWLLYHLSAVILYPASVPAPPGYLLYDFCGRFYSWYMEGIHMIHGHRFFSPDPPEYGLLIKYEIAFDDGSVSVYEFPNREISPRLMYHRYFMLSERSEDAFERDEWFRGYARSLLKTHDSPEKHGERIVLIREYHYVLSPKDIIDGRSMTDPELYEQEELGVWTREELGLDG